jgi:hypothetical protein
MNDREKLKQYFNCPICEQKFNHRNRMPKLLTCGKSVCHRCIKDSFRNEIFYCKFCLKEHNYPSIDSIPTNDILSILINNNSEVSELEKDEDSREKSKGSNNKNNRNISLLKSNSVDFNRNNRTDKQRRMSTVLSEVKRNSNDLETCIVNSREKLLYHYNTLENEINLKADNLIKSLNEARDNLIKELTMHKNSALQYLSEGIETKSPIIQFKDDCKKNYQKLMEASKSEYLDERDAKNISAIADELNERIMSIKIYFESCIKSDLKFIKSKYQALDSSFIGRLEFKKPKLFDNNLMSKMTSNSSQQTHSLNNNRSYFVNNLDSHRIIELSKSKAINYKVPFNTKNVLINVLGNKTIIKATEIATIDDYSYTLSLHMLNSDGHIINKHSEEIGSYRLKKLQTCATNNFIAVILVNKFLNHLNYLKLFDQELNPLHTIELHYMPIDLYMNSSGIYVRSNNYNLNINKYDYNLNHLKSFGQGVNENESYFIDRNHKLISIENEKIYLIDYEKSKIRILSELSGKYLKSFEVSEDRNFLCKIDSTERFTILNRKQFKLNVFNWDNLLLYQKKLDYSIQSVDEFFVLRDGSYCIIDRKNHLIHFF